MSSLILFFLVSAFPVSFVVADVVSGGERNCSCGFYENVTGNFFTESIIVYFNESTALTGDFIIEQYEHKYEKDWNSIYRHGADISNVQMNNSQYLEILVSQPTKDHLVKGGSIRTIRRDIQYGSFRALLQAPPRGAGGSAVSMITQHNETQTLELSVMNRNSPSDAWIGTFINNEFTSRELGVNFSTAINATSANRNYTVLQGASSNGSINPWEFTEYRIDWTKDYVRFYVGGNLTRSISRKENAGLPSVPAPLYFKHWSTGNQYSMEGPPRQQSGAKLGWARLFFNSSLTTKEERDSFAKDCSLSDACSVDDVSLRGSSAYPERATQKWKQNKKKDLKRMPALWVSVICLSFSSLLLFHTFLRRAPWRHSSISATQKHSAPSKSDETLFNSEAESIKSDNSSNERRSDGPSLGLSQDSSANGPQWQESEDDIPLAKDSAVNSLHAATNQGESSRPPSLLRFDSDATTLRVLSPYASDFNTTMTDLTEEKELRTTVQVQTILEGKEGVCTPPEGHPAVTEAIPPPARDRIDHLAGLVALCAILVTVMHFGLTFVPAMVIPGAPIHYKSEYWAQKIISPFILNQMWLGVFFTTSTRFLVSPYLKSGDLKAIAKGAVRRCPRLMIPITAVALLEYFLIDCGITSYLRYIPSLTWSTWPYVTRFPTIGHFISEILELLYLIPNAVPQITFHFCTGVLWTIAVQLQGSWLVFTGVIVVYEIKTAWKRFLYYAFCIANHWYAESWGSYLWFGLLLADLDITYHYKPWLYKRRAAYYPLMIFCWICVALGFAANVLPSWTHFNFAVYEHNLHPDPSSGLPIGDTPNAGYPVYYVPRFNGLLFAAGLQAIVELSIVIQSILSFRIFLFLFPHIFTIYLLHGIVFWSWGSWLLIVLAERDFSYGISVTIVGMTSYTVIFLILPIATPIIETLGKDITAQVWRNASEKSPPKRRTLFPFPEDLFSSREKEGDVEASVGAEMSTVVVTGEGGVGDV
ncbi:hypothetical protein GQ43DRAFT_451299 [Delitschia confertaspora ATCC 74209]|uniref:GH16 domain-containing protein n=1 Tax=Delitschia confertaspora ATCC 74209 TaxID=1513339 RepID=A0A9P4JEN1_9PLEO|nr:hypothetical protein GQ43DRAFT_451299 [Delitschia confertaspora ATCC 74209]